MKQLGTEPLDHKIRTSPRLTGRQGRFGRRSQSLKVERRGWRQNKTDTCPPTSAHRLLGTADDRLGCPCLAVSDALCRGQGSSIIRDSSGAAAMGRVPFPTRRLFWPGIRSIMLYRGTGRSKACNVASSCRGLAQGGGTGVFEGSRILELPACPSFNDLVILAEFNGPSGSLLGGWRILAFTLPRIIDIVACMRRKRQRWGNSRKNPIINQSETTGERNPHAGLYIHK